LARRYPAEISPLMGMADFSAAAFESLARLVPMGDFGVLFVEAAPSLPAGWMLVREVPLAQMIWGGERKVPALAVGSAASPAGKTERAENAIEQLGAEDVDQMLALTELTKPGPFGRRTHELGTYLGFRADGRLVAMAGERLRLPGFTEVSAVCTHPEFVGRGYARALVAAVVQGILGRGECPFLHVARENARAQQLYEGRGFVVRKLFTVVVLGRE
jgi:ribosomal protein S18 acetylase RimI-like enzyme